MPKFTKLLGSCKTAGLIDAGTLRSSLTAQEWHASCAGGHINGRGEVTVCNCACHADHRSCLKCGATDTELVDDPNSKLELQCADTEACVERYRSALDSSPRATRFRHYKEVAEANRAAEAAEEKRAIEAGERAPRRKATARQCAHGCGEMTKGGLFIAGHDAKLKGILMRAGEAGDVSSIVELKLRNWFPTSGRGADRYAAADVAAADDRVQNTNTEAYLDARVAERTALVAEGAEPEDAVRQIGGVA